MSSRPNLEGRSRVVYYTDKWEIYAPACGQLGQEVALVFDRLQPVLLPVGVDRYGNSSSLTHFSSFQVEQPQ